MDKLILYLLESSVILAVFYLLYVLILRKETFFNLNRFFLLVILAGSLLIPFVSFDLNPMGNQASLYQLNQIRISYHDVIRDLSFERQDTETYSEVSPVIQRGKTNDWSMLWTSVIFIIYVSGTLLCLSRMMWSLWRIRRVIKSHPHSTVHGVSVVRLPQPVAPFSFCNYVFVSEELMKSSNFDQVLAHEKVHVHQRHTIDLIFSQIYAAFYWFNPVVWFVNRSLKTVHEYIADKETIDKGYTVIAYQTMLLDQLINNHSYDLVHNFNLSSIKKRLTMMSIPQSGLTGKVKAVITLIGALGFSVLIVQCNAVMEEQTSGGSQDVTDTPASKTGYAEGEMDDRIVIVNIGMHSRGQIAEMINTINEKNPRVVGVDAFFISPKEDTQSDERLADALASTQNLIMAGRLRDSTISTSWSKFSEGSVLNFVNLIANNDDNKVELFWPSVEVEGEKVYAFAMEMARQYDPQSIQRYERNGMTRIDYSGNVIDGLSESQRRFVAIDAKNVLENNFKTDIEGKIVLFGFLGEYLGQPDVKEDRFITPLNDSDTQETPDMYGVVVHANIISQILDGR